MSHFDLLGLAPAFTLDLAELEKNYFAAQRQFHPDRFVGKPPAERALAAGRSADINHAYNTLKNPLSRAQYLLQMQGIRVGTEADNVKPSQAILIEAMELREEPPAGSALDHMIQESLANISAYFERSELDAMAQETLRLGYLMKAKK